MPLWRIFSNPATFGVSQRQALAESITSLYTSIGLPAFYVNVLFIDVPATHMYVSGRPKPNFVRIVVEQIARTMPSPDTEEGRAQRTGWMDKINDAIRPFIIERADLAWELHVAETPRDLWRVQGLDAPPAESQAEKMWVREDKPTPWKHLN